MMKTLYDISWKVDEPTYRADPALSYSKLARFKELGFASLDKLDDKVESPSLTIGSAVDALITGGEEEFNARFYPTDLPTLSDTLTKIAQALFDTYKDVYSSLDDMQNINILPILNQFGYQSNWGDDKRVAKIKDSCNEYYVTLYSAKDKTILNSNTTTLVREAANTLKSSKTTRWYFAENNPFDTSIVRFYQLKFKHEIKNVMYRCMADEIIVDHKNKTIQPIDLKTTGHNEYDFYKSFVKWNYQIQARLYWRLIILTCLSDDEYKDYTVLPYKFIVINVSNLIPLVWSCPFTSKYGDLTFGENKNIVFKDPFSIGEELNYYLSKKPKVPIGITIKGDNDLEEWLNTM